MNPKASDDSKESRGDKTLARPHVERYACYIRTGNVKLSQIK